MGRAPSSGNCHTCRARRVKCDKSRPVCERCTKGGYTCAGYETVLRMQNHAAVAGVEPGSSRLAKVQAISSFPSGSVGATAKRLPARRKRDQTVSSQTYGKESIESVPTEIGSISTTTGSSTSPSQIVLKTSGSNSSSSSSSSSPGADSQSSIPQQMDLTPFVDDISFSYFFQSYGWINMHSILLQDTAMRSHLSSEAMSYDSLRALSYGLFGRDHHLDNLKQSASRLYGSTLNTLRVKLGSNSKHELAELIRPIAIMGSYAVAVEHDLRFTHNRGLARILEHCGPEAFQSPSLLPVFESCRLTLISQSIVARKRSFLEEPEWKTVPWEKLPERKTPISKLLDIMADIPAIIQGAWDVMRDRIQWTKSGYQSRRWETPETLPRLLKRVTDAREQLRVWLVEWKHVNFFGGHELIEWAFRVAQDDDYRPGVAGAEGPDVYEMSMLFDLFPDKSSTQQPPATQQTFTQMQDLTYYTTVLIWTTRLIKYIDAATKSPTSTTFFNTPFFSNCTCCTSYNAVPCQTIPSTWANVEPGMTWNVMAAKMAAGPIRLESENSVAASSSMNLYSTASSNTPMSRSSSEHTFADIAVLLPGDVRFAAQLRLLSWLVDHLPASRAQVLGALAAIGLAHCAHDVRPTEGIAAVATAVGRVLDSTKVEGAQHLLLRQYR